MSWVDVSFAAYLEAKRRLDDTALNANVCRRLQSAVAGYPGAGQFRVLDLGTGSGAMAYRLARELAPLRADKAGTRIRGVDHDPELIRSAEAAAAALPGDAPVPEFAVMTVEDALSTPDSHDLVTAHSLMDLLPLEEICQAVRYAVVPGGLFYATMNYNGLTRWYPQASDAEFEQELLRLYDRSMLRSNAAGRPQDGASSGGRLYEACRAVGLDLQAVGGADWCVFPDGSGQYPDGQARVMQWMLSNIHKEGRAVLPSAAMDAWLHERQAALLGGELCLVVHHLDLLASRPR